MLQGGRLAPYPSLHCPRLRTPATLELVEESRFPAPVHAEEKPVPPGIGPKLGRRVGAEGDSAQWDLAMGGVILTTAVGTNDGRDSRVKLRDGRDGQSHSLGAATSTARHNGLCTLLSANRIDNHIPDSGTRTKMQTRCRDGIQFA